MKLQSGTIYMTSVSDLDNPVMGVIVKRMWWKPWRWSATPVYYSEQLFPGMVSGVREAEPVTNLTKAGVIGYAKLLGVSHRDFEDAMYMRTDGV